MQTLTHSAFLQSLGYAIANSLWQVALMWIIVMTLNNLFRFSASVKYRIAITAQVAAFCWFVFTLFFYYSTSSEALAEAAALRSSGSLLVQPAPELYQSGLLSFIVRTEQLLPYLSVAYLLLLSFLVVKWIRSYRYTTLVQTHGLHKIDVDWKLFVKRIAAQLGIKSEVKIYLSELVKSPMTIGFLKPVILIPLASMNHLSVEQLEAIILHEMAHIRRLDYVINLFVSITEICLFFNPFTQLLSKIIKNERENSCDDWVLQYQYQPAMYAEALLRLAYLQATPSLAMHAVSNKQLLLTRVKRMLEQNQNKFNYRQQLLALLLMTGVLSSLAWLQPKSSPQKPVSVIERSVGEPLMAKVENPLFNPAFFLTKPLKEEAHKALAEQKRNLEKAQVILRELNIPSIVPVTAERIREVRLATINNTQLAKANKFWYQLSDMNTGKNEELFASATALNAQAIKLDSLSALVQLRGVYTQSPMVINVEKLKLEMTKVKAEMAKIEKQGIKWDEKLFEQKLASTLFKMPSAPSTAGFGSSAPYEGFVQRWVESATASDLKQRTEAMKAANESKDQQVIERSRQPYREMISGYSNEMYYSVDDAPVAETKERTRLAAGNNRPVTVFGSRSPQVSKRKTDTEIVTVGPPQDNNNITTVNVVKGIGASGQGLTLLTSNGTLIKASKNVPKQTTQTAPAPHRRILRVESF